MQEILNDTSWKKAFELIQEKFGKTLIYRPIHLLEHSSEMNDFYIQGDDIVIPLRSKSFPLGEVIVSRGYFLASQEKNDVVDLVKFLIEPKLYHIHLKQVEQNAYLNQELTLHQRSSDEGKVIDLFKIKTTEKKTLSQVIHLKSQNSQTRHKVALKIHEMAEKNLFVFLDDISASLTNVEDIKTLNDTTVYVEDVSQLSASMITLLTAYLDLSLNSGPLFLIGSNIDLEAVEKNTNWPSTLKKDLMGFYFDIDRVPISQQTSTEILELLFFELDKTMT